MNDTKYPQWMNEWMEKLFISWDLKREKGKNPMWEWKERKNWNVQKWKVREILALEFELVESKILNFTEWSNETHFGKI